MVRLIDERVRLDGQEVRVVVARGEPHQQVARRREQLGRVRPRRSKYRRGLVDDRDDEFIADQPARVQFDPGSAPRLSSRPVTPSRIGALAELICAVFA